MPNCGCKETISLNLFVNSDCNPPDANAFCTQGFRITAPGADPNQGPGQCPIDVGQAAGCSSLTSGCSYRFVAPGFIADGQIVAHFIWNAQAVDTISIPDGSVVGISNVNPPGGATWNPATKTINAAGGSVEFDLVVTGSAFTLSYSSAANQLDLEICAISYQKRV